jgi:UPF0755 protein
LQIAQNLKQEKRIDSKVLFVLNSLKDKNYTKLKAGRYSFDNLTNKEIINLFIKGEKVKEYIKIIPGWDIEDIALEVYRNGICTKQEFLDKYSSLTDEQDNYLKERFPFLKDKPSKAGLEGYFYPDTYEIDSSQGIEFFVDQVLSNFDQKLNLELREEVEKQNKSIFEIVTMASMLEKEVISFEDKCLVSDILWRRLKVNMLLEVDSTYLYLNSFSDKHSNSLYNTYRYSGLPIGPISNPNMESIRAAIYPQKSDYWFYLSASENETIFSKNYNEHLINKYKYLNK